MTIEQLRRIHRTEPFEPFTVRTADGLHFEVVHPEIMAISPVGRTIVIMTPDGAHDTIDVLMITSVRTGNGKARRRRKP